MWRWLGFLVAGAIVWATLVSPHHSALAESRGEVDDAVRVATTTTPPHPATAMVAPAPPPAPGYGVFGSDGGVFAFGAVRFAGSAAALHLPSPVVAAAGTRSAHGYWMATADGGVFTFGDARFFGSASGQTTGSPIVALVVTPTEAGYWLVTSGGQVTAFGDAALLPISVGQAPIVAAAATPSGRGLWLADITGAVHPEGDAVALPRPDRGPESARPLAGIAPTPSGRGYWLTYVDGTIAPVGDAKPLGSLAGTPLVAPIVGMVASLDGNGLLLSGDDGGVFRFGQAPYLGSAATYHPKTGIMGLVVPGTSVSAGAALLLGLYSAKTFALTFDDGPNPQFTPQLLDLFVRKHVLATFFEIGRQVEALPQFSAAVAAAGDVVGNHTFNHPMMTSLSDAALNAEMDRTSQAIQQATGRLPRCFRPPYGATNGSIASRMAAKGMAQQMWTVDPSDYRRPPSAQIVANVLANAAPGGVVILHDGGGDRSQTVIAVSQIIDGLRARGFTLVPVCW